MAYTVLARKYRSRTFDEIVGQDAIATTLKNAVSSGRIHHGYLFTGTRGVGKTSLARILAKSLNCLNAEGPTITPCLECESCRMIAQGDDLDVIEIDAASNTGVDNIRDLRSNSLYRPARSRFKIYIIDEVHMLSTGAFNALLKTLEEPPEHVKFILATTEIQKVPATIQSRCQRFEFRSINIDTIVAQLDHILEAEHIKADPAVVRRVARLATGSMRDALSLLDQLLAFGGDTLDQDLIEQVLPTPHDEFIFELVDRLGSQDPAAALACVEKCLSAGQTAERFCESLIEHLRTLMLLAVCGEQTDLIDAPTPLREQLVKQAARFDAPSYVYMISLLQELRRSVKFASAGRALVDAAVVRLALTEQFSDIKTLLASVGAAPAQPAGQKASSPAPPKPISTPAAKSPSKAAPKKAAPSSTISPQTRQQVMADPTVKRAMELFDGSIAEIRPSTNVTAPSETDPGPPATPT